MEQRYADLVPDQTPGFAHRVCLARAALARRDLRRAEELLAAGPAGLPETVATVTAGLVGALVADARGHPTRAVDLLAKAVQLADVEGIRRPFITLSGRRLHELLDRLRLLAPNHAPFADGILTDIRPATHAPAGTAGTGLSEREAEVMHYLPTNLTAAEIATELGVSVNTVKAHMRSIYRKLGATKRSEAVAHARTNGII